jgi:hypothetical protein
MLLHLLLPVLRNGGGGEGNGGAQGGCSLL